MSTLSADSRRLAVALKRYGEKVVFAESCTGGLVSASLASVPGISEYLCGSAVTYRNETKQHWLDVPGEKLIKPGPVSKVVACEMAAGVLTMTPEAGWSSSVTGHLGPNAPKRFDGVVYVGVGHRTPNESPPHAYRVMALRYVLKSKTRLQRQREATSLVLRTLLDAIIQWHEKR